MIGLEQFAKQEAQRGDPFEAYLIQRGLFSEVMPFLITNPKKLTIVLRWLKKYHEYPWDSTKQIARFRDKIVRDQMQ